MTMLNGEPIDTGVPTTAPSVQPIPGPARGDGVNPIKNPVASIVGIFGLIFAFAFPPAGLVMSIIAKSMSKRAGDRNPFATWGIWLGAVFTVLGLLALAAWIAFTIWLTTAGFEACITGTGDPDFLGVPIECGTVTG